MSEDLKKEPDSTITGLETIDSFFSENEAIDEKVDEKPENDDKITQDIELNNDLVSIIRNAKIPTKQENIELAIRAQNGDEKAMEDIMIRNGRLVLKSLRKYGGLSFSVQDDLLQEGLLGIRRAVQTYDPNMNASFTTYAVPWLRQYMSRYIYNSYQSVRVPIHVLENINRIRRKLTENEAKNITMTDEEMAEALGLTVEKLQMCYVNMQSSQSLDAEIKIDDTNDTQVSLMDAIASKESVEKDVETSMANQAIMNVMDTCLTEREKDIVLKRFGFYDGQIWTLDQVAEGYGVTRERIRQIEEKALRKMRSPRRKRELIDFLK